MYLCYEVILWNNELTAFLEVVYILALQKTLSDKAKKKNKEYF